MLPRPGAPAARPSQHCVPSLSSSLSCCHSLYVLLLSSQHIKLLSGNERGEWQCGGGSDKRQLRLQAKAFASLNGNRYINQRQITNAAQFSSRNSVGSGRTGRGDKERSVRGWVGRRKLKKVFACVVNSCATVEHCS